MQRPRIEFGTIQSFTGQPDCTVAIELPFINIALPDWIKHNPEDPIGPTTWQALTLANMEQLITYLAKQSLTLDPCRSATLLGIRGAITSESIHVRWVPGNPSDYLS